MNFLNLLYCLVSVIENNITKYLIKSNFTHLRFITH